MINPGQMRWTCSVKRRDAVDALGKHNSTETSVTSFRASVTDIGSSEGEWGGGAAGMRSYEVKTRYSSDSAGVGERDYLILTDGVNTITANITSIQNESLRNRVITFTCEEILK